ncbi:MAG: response regulator [Bdellovibrionales bacterium]|nr:response regulator [Bdellovibrionales bacterium]
MRYSETMDGRKILLVDDEDDIREILQTRLEMSGFEVASSPSGNEAIRLIQSGYKPNLVLSDGRMPNGDGPSLFRWLKENSVDCPVVFMTGFTDDAEHGFSGAAAVFAKPFSFDDLLKKIEELFS